ncbi:hypothetical protein EYF80_026645 [Liparis tanakae]|uniref:Uncharacterized protein n=1 Tax=Liparis tanakae TaxID=230148 RepID=A0A4Z2HC26_9TELE|nr:hypothetical protein EYF80_026645 [Liparis tanakae]
MKEEAQRQQSRRGRDTEKTSGVVAGDAVRRGTDLETSRRTLGALVSVDAYEVGEGGAAGEQRGGVGAEEGQQDLFKQQRDRNTFDTADRGVRQLRRGRGEEDEEEIINFISVEFNTHIHIVLVSLL